MRSIWSKLASKIVYQSAWIRVREDTVVKPDGKPGVYGVVELKGGIGVVAMTDKDEVFLVGQYRYAPGVYSLEIPKGAFQTFESKEDPLKTAQRELKEETGISAREWVKLGTVHTLMGATNDIVHLFLARSLQEGKASPEETEDIAVIKVPLGELIKIICAGKEILVNRRGFHHSDKLTDATSIAAIFWAKDFLLCQKSVKQE
jgi:8-oxo-dGTP pyrophosphatase MutT (NUDIX family)